MPPSPCSGSTNTAAVRPFWIAARADSKSSYFASTAPPMSGKKGVLYCSCSTAGRTVQAFRRTLIRSGSGEGTQPRRWRARWPNASGVIVTSGGRTAHAFRLH